MKKKFLEKELQKTKKQSLELKKYLREKAINNISNGKNMIIHLTVGLTKKISSYKKRYFSEPYTRSKKKKKIELDLSCYAIKYDLKIAIGIDKSKFA